MSLDSSPTWVTTACPWTKLTTMKNTLEPSLSRASVKTPAPKTTQMCQKEGVVQLPRSFATISASWRFSILFARLCSLVSRPKPILQKFQLSVLLRGPFSAFLSNVEAVSLKEMHSYVLLEIVKMQSKLAIKISLLCASLLKPQPQMVLNCCLSNEVLSWPCAPSFLVSSKSRMA